MSIHQFFYRHPLLTFFVLVVTGLAFGALTLNIFRLVAENWQFITRHGVVALREGGLQQAFELLCSGLIAMCIYVLFKFCERTLLDWLRDRKLPFSKKKRG